MLLSVITLALCLTGCVYEELSVKLNKDGTGSIETTIGLKKEFARQLKELGGTDPLADKKRPKPSTTAKRISSLRRRRNINPLKKWKGL